MQDQFDRAALAIFSGDTQALERICAANPTVARHRAAVGHSTLLQIVACEEPHLPGPAEAVRVLLQAGAETTGPLISAAGCNAHSVVTAMLDLGVGVDTDSDWTPLDEALYWDNADMAIALCDRGADTNRLRRAAGLGDVDHCNSFFDGHDLGIAAGPIRSPFATTFTDTEASDPALILDHALVMAANCGRTATVEALFARGVRLNQAPPGYHWLGTALHAAIWHGHLDTVRWLLDHGADRTIRDGLADADALGWAEHHGHPAIVDLLAG